MNNRITALPEADSDLLHLAADLLYDATDPRANPWPAAATLGQIRSRLRGLADWLESEASHPTAGNASTPAPERLP